MVSALAQALQNRRERIGKGKGTASKGIASKGIASKDDNATEKVSSGRRELEALVLEWKAWAREQKEMGGKPCSFTTYRQIINEIKLELSME